MQDNLSGARPRSEQSVGAWLSLVEHSVRDRGVGGSNPLAPTNFFRGASPRPPLLKLRRGSPKRLWREGGRAPLHAHSLAASPARSVRVAHSRCSFATC